MFQAKDYATLYRKDDEWHHLAVTWKYDTGALEFYFDGQMQTPYWRSNGNAVSVKDPTQGGVEKTIASQTERADQGELQGPPPPLHSCSGSQMQTLTQPHMGNKHYAILKFSLLILAADNSYLICNSAAVDGATWP